MSRVYVIWLLIQVSILYSIYETISLLINSIDFHRILSKHVISTQGSNGFSMQNELNLEDSTQKSTLTLTKIDKSMLTEPNYSPHFKANKIGVDSVLIQRIITHTNKYGYCIEQLKFAGLRLNSNHLWFCSLYIYQFVPLKPSLPMNTVETIVNGTDIQFEYSVNMMPSKYVERTFDGSEENFARLQNDYYHSQVAIGDPIRSKRTKRIAIYTNEM